MYKWAKKLIKRSSVKDRQRFLAIISFATIGTILLFTTHAATPYISVEAESGTPSGGAVVVGGDASASGSSYVKFGTVATANLTLAITVPTAGATLTGASASLKATYTGNVKNVEFYNSSTLLATATLSNGTATATFDSQNYPNGSFTISATAWDSPAGQPATQTVNASPVTATVQNATQPPPTGMVPNGIPGNWSLVFNDEFNGTSLDRNRWEPSWYNQESAVNNVPTRPWNVAVTGGNLVLTLSGPQDGAAISSNPAFGNAGTGFSFSSGVAEARVYFPGNGRTIYNWPAFWTNSNNWATTGEVDIAEGLGELTTNYWAAPNGYAQGFNGPAPPGTWSNAFHTYAVRRAPGMVYVYWDGVQVWSRASYDNGAQQFLEFNVGCFNSSQPNIGKGCGSNDTHVFGTNSQVKVDYVRVWQ